MAKKGAEMTKPPRHEQTFSSRPREIKSQTNSDSTLGNKARASRGPGSFCVPRRAIEALLDAKATAYEICAYLVLARYTDSTGCYSSASVSAVNKATGVNKVKGGPADRAIKRLKGIRARRKTRVSNDASGASLGTIDDVDDLGPILFDRDTWREMTGDILPDGPSERGLVRHVLPELDEVVEERVWFGNNLVSGVGGFDQPLKALKNAGDVAARLLLAMYAANDMEVWGGVRPCGPGSGPWKHYEPWKDAEGKPLADVHLHGGARLIRAKGQGEVASADWKRISGGDVEAYFDALRALESVGLAYQVVMVLNRNAKKATFSGGEEYGNIPDDAEPYYELDPRSAHGYKPAGEEGIGGVTARTAGDIGYPVSGKGGLFDGTYAAIVPAGFPAMIAGIYRLRFRLANPKNVGVKGAWARIHTNNRDAYQFVQRVRAGYGLPEVAAPWDRPQPQPTAPDPEIPF